MIKGYFKEFTAELGKIVLSIGKHDNGVLNKIISLKFKHIIVTFLKELENLEIDLSMLNTTTPYILLSNSKL